MNETKYEQRIIYREKRRLYDAAKAAKKDAEICRNLIEWDLFIKADAVLAFAPVRGEPDIVPFIRFAEGKAGKTVAFPICDRNTGIMEFRVCRYDLLKPGTYGIREPDRDAPEVTFTDRTLCVVSGLAFDTLGGRLGQGGGYYDRFLADFVGITVAPVRSDLISDRIACEPHDIPVMYIVNEKGVRPAESEDLRKN